MAMQPIDLQTLFTQLDKVAKTQSAQREGLAIQQEMQGVLLQRKTEQHIQSINKPQNTGDDGAEKVNDKSKGQSGRGGGKKQKEDRQQDAEAEETPPAFFDPSLGRNIDISL